MLAAPSLALGRSHEAQEVQVTFTCPNGHQSADPEWCDTCGSRLGEAATPAGSAPGSAEGPAPSGASSDPAAIPTATALECPHCGTPNEPGALFCEGCGYDFTTGQAPPDTEEEAVTVPPPEAGQESSGWVMIVEVDPAWHELKGQLAEQPLPSPTSSTVPLAATTALIGRTSRSRQLHPEVALDGDTGVSRRHAQVVHQSSDPSGDGSWTIVDLGSSNGTYVLAAGETPTADTEAIPVGIPHPLADQDVIYLGAWTKLTLRNTR
ncbi:MAG: FHA domain-containing protein [Ilumatobacteraceae bacterium]